MNALCSYRWDISLCMIRCAITVKKTRTCLEYYEIPVLKWPGNSPEMNSIEKVSNIMKDNIGNQLSCLKEEM